MFYNDHLSFSVFVLVSFIAEDPSAENFNHNFPLETCSILLSAIAFSPAAVLVISYITAWCVRTVSDTT